MEEAEEPGGIEDQNDEETRNAAIEAMKDVLDADFNDEQLGAAFDAAVAIVKKQFGM